MKRDNTETAARNFDSDDSFVGMDGCDYLAGPDKKARRREVFERAEGRCEVCKRYAPLDGIPGYRGEWHHVQSGLVGRCDCLHNASWRCGNRIRGCHRDEHPQVQLRWIPQEVGNGE